MFCEYGIWIAYTGLDDIFNDFHKFKLFQSVYELELHNPQVKLFYTFVNLFQIKAIHYY